ncbi:metal-dependent hydrolase family protein [Kineobactrum salinum]|uniref:Amidohydrolase family protein n=1 Tax=Kineobactrum salinum TaxID=2708301 RepID=A0A6C0U4R1_9GAMM|nr:amidohydrolase family protein [Kineobactrum salinum]QIB66986.1 amidohydrolase family protein [Kineobactrum salinum]
MMHRTKTTGLATALCIAITALGANATTYQEIRCGTLLDVEQEKTLTDQRILVRDDVIAEIGKSVSSPEGTAVIDLSDRVCMPGLMDMHTHLFIDTTGVTLDQSAPTRSSAFNTIKGLQNLKVLLDSGFTTVRVPGDFDYYYAGIELRDAIARGELRGPRMLVAPHAISPLGGHGDLNTYAPDLPHPVMGPMIADGEEAIRRAVRKEIKHGADWIKVMATGGVMSQRDDPEVSAYTKDEFRAFAEEAHRHNRKITAHAHGDAGIRAAVEAGFDSIEHATLAEPETARLMAKKGTYYVPTLYVVDWILEQGQSGGISADNLKKARLVARKHAGSVKLAYDAGVKMVVGSDPIFPMEQAVREFNAMAKRIPDNWYVLKAGTISAAEMLGLQESIGSLTEGKQADIVAAPENPIDDMSHIESVNFVMKGGVVIRNN